MRVLGIGILICASITFAGCVGSPSPPGATLAAPDSIAAARFAGEIGARARALPAAQRFVDPQQTRAPTWVKAAYANRLSDGDLCAPAAEGTLHLCTQGLTAPRAGGAIPRTLTKDGMRAYIARFDAVSEASGTEPSAPVRVQGITGAIDVSAGTAHACAIDGAGRARCWGGNRYGQLGDGTRRGASRPVFVQGINAPVIDISVGDNHTCAVTADGGAWCWGDNARYQLGVYGKARKRPVPVRGIDQGARAISAGNGFTCALLDGGVVKCWGDTALLGNAALARRGYSTSYTVTYRSANPQTVVPAGAVQLSAGGRQACVLRGTGSIACWGTVGDVTHVRPAPVAGAPRHSTDIATSPDFSNDGACLVTRSHQARCWGIGEKGQLGFAPANYLTARPQAVPGLADARAISMGIEHTCATRITGAVTCWGSNDFGEATGAGTTQPADARDDEYGNPHVPPHDVAGLPGRATMVTAGADYSCALMVTGTIMCWGNNAAGNLGSGRATTTRGLLIAIDMDQPGATMPSRCSRQLDTCAGERYEGVSYWVPID